ncbi:hypothetical protein H5P28_06965 [Ruficoccus amylovorans]|uniref:Uncharacterized protein n=1 Tax=Ruficoccus amylovorans TaxID=1804625 RepID=A0A842HCS8_9BACT|nr:hypothetical protein [Ruficoccus amylovorans]MBC2593999.1 hypothetical protein [Ruficoccus amylovorans]
MAFIFLLLVSVATLTKVETSSVAITQVQTQARQNALFAMEMAMAELQRAAGPDQRSTASAALGEADTQNGGSTAHRTVQNGLTEARNGARHWTGVWGNKDVGERIYTATPAPILLNWLVSGNEGAAFSVAAQGNVVSSAITAGDGSIFAPDNGSIPASLDLGALSVDEEWALLVGPGSVSDEQDYVVAPQVHLDETNSYAWWVGDEGIKADFGAYKPYAGTAVDNTTLDGRYWLSLAQRNGVELMTGFENYPLLLDEDNIAQVENVLQRDQVRLSVPTVSEQQMKARFHDLTASAWGVLADNRNGGLRRDLTGHLHGGTLTGKVIPTLTYSEDAALRNEINSLSNPRWEQLKSFWDQVASVAETGYVDVGSTVGDANVHHVTPVLVQLRVLVRLRVAPAANDTEPRQVFMGVAPIVVLGNPYNVPLRSDGVDFRYHPRGGRSEISEETQIEMSLIGPGGVIGAPMRYLKRYNDSPADRSLLGNITMRTGAFTIQPGELAVFSLGANTIAGGNGVVVVGMQEGVAGLDPDCAIELPIGYIQPGDFNDETVSTKTWEIKTDLPSGNWGRFAFSMYPTGHGDADDPLDERPLQRIEQVDLEGTATDLVFTAPKLADTSVAAATEEEAFANSYFRPYFARTHHLVMPGAQQGRQRIYANYNLRAQLWRRPLRDDRANAIQSNPLINIQYPAALGDAAIAFFGADLPPRWGRDIDSSGTDKVVLFDMIQADDSDSPLLSMADFSHANLTFILNASLPLLGQSAANIRNMSVGEQGGYSVGNSWANPYLSPQYTAAGSSYTMSDGTRLWESSQDTSYLLNCALFDGYFFSTVPQSEGAVLPDYLPNGRLQPLTEDMSLLQDPDEVAAHMMIRGAFNVNSVSVQAWKAVLAATRLGLDESPYARSLYQPGGTNGNDGDLEDIYSGYRSLSDEQIAALAEVMVSEVRQRGPFTSLAHFLNRSLQGNGALIQKGAIQSALDRATVDGVALNDPARFDENNTPTTADSAAYPNVNAALGAQAAGAPGWLTQADLLKVLGPILSARSDTFTIRAYGEVRNPLTGAVEAAQWCEALVQRTPVPVNPSTANANEPADKNDLGRRFKIVAFRWLDADSV